MLQIMKKNMLRNLDKKYIKYYDWINSKKSKLLSKGELSLYQYDWVRFAVSLALLDQYYGDKDLVVLELGGPGASTKFIKNYFPKWEVINYEEDLREPHWSLPKNHFDLILNMEVIEHLTDLFVGKVGSSDYCFDYNAKFVYSGALNCMYECNRVLKPDGAMFLTTPNVHGYINLYKMLVGEVPYQWPNHIREYTLQELEEIIKETGFSVKNYENAEILCTDWDFSYLENYIKDNKYREENRWSGYFFNIVVSKKMENNISKEKHLTYVDQIIQERNKKIQKFELLLTQKDSKINELVNSNQVNMQTLDMMTNSLSWKLTRPIRLLVRLFRRIILK